jgi:hypothetical protein
MPGEMIDYCQAPTPYLIGVHSSLYQTLIEDVGQNMIEDGICILDIDNQAFYSNFKSKDIGKFIRIVINRRKHLIGQIETVTLS